MKSPFPPHSSSSIELLEPRIAPASITFTDVDGDLIHVTVSGGATEEVLDHAVHRTASGVGFKITSVALGSQSVFQDVDLTITADLVGGGDGLVNVGGINAKKLDLHNVTIDGNLVQIDVGDAITSTPALNLLTAESFGVPAGGSGDAPASFINGRVGTLEVHGDVNKAWIRVAAAKASRPDGSIGTVLITGALIGGKSDHAGSITATGEITTVTVDGDLVGGKGRESGTIGTFGKIGTISVGDVIGGSRRHSGAIITHGGIDNVTLNGSLTGGAGNESGAVGSFLPIGSVTVLGSVAGGAGKRSGEIVSKTSLGTIFVQNSLTGGKGALSGAIGSAGDISSVLIGGPLIGGKQPFTGAILSGRDIGSVGVTGGIQTDPLVKARFTAVISARGRLGNLGLGNLSGHADNRVLIAADADPIFATANVLPAIGSISTLTVEFATILGGFAFLPGHTYRNADASIGVVNVDGSWTASTLAAGALVPDRLFQGLQLADTDRQLIHDGGKRGITSSISSISIMGDIRRDPKGATISGFIAEQIFLASCAGTPFDPLSTGPHNDDQTIVNINDRIVGLLTEGKA